jgi:hypothetical protein
MVVNGKKKGTIATIMIAHKASIIGKSYFIIGQFSPWGALCISKCIGNNGVFITLRHK